ncbi:MAG: PA0069 family radical SAM protein [Gammaproteobacteria bacterium]
MHAALASLKGRGTPSRIPGRFDPILRSREPDGWASVPEALVPGRQELLPEQARSIISRNDSPDVPFSQSVNPYRGCEHGCVYCYARPSHGYLDLSPGLDFEQRIRFKANAPELLDRELSRSTYRCEPLAIGSNTDAYHPAEAELGLTRKLLEVCLAHRQPVSIVTKSALVLRDADILSALSEQGLCHVYLSVTTLDDELKRRLEPRTASGRARLRVVTELAARGIPTGVLVAPVIPALNDSGIERILALAAAAGARKAGWILLRLPHEVAPLFRQWLAEHYPERAAHVMSLLQQMRGGRDNDPRFGSRMRGAGAFATLFSQRFRVAARRAGLDGRDWPALDTTRFVGAEPRAARQLALI